MLQDAGVSNQDAAKIVDAMKPIYNPRNIRSGQAFKATFGAAKDAPPYERIVPTTYIANSADDLLGIQFAGLAAGLEERKEVDAAAPEPTPSGPAPAGDAPSGPATDERRPTRLVHALAEATRAEEVRRNPADDPFRGLVR